MSSENISRIKARLAQIEEELKPGGILLGGQKEVVIRELTQSLGVAVEALESIENRYEHPHDLHNINSARLRGCQLEAKSSLSKIAKILSGEAVEAGE